MTPSPQTNGVKAGLQRHGFPPPFSPRKGRARNGDRTLDIDPITVEKSGASDARFLLLFLFPLKRGRGDRRTRALPQFRQCTRRLFPSPVERHPLVASLAGGLRRRGLAPKRFGHRRDCIERRQARLGDVGGELFRFCNVVYATIDRGDSRRVSRSKAVPTRPSSPDRGSGSLCPSVCLGLFDGRCPSTATRHCAVAVAAGRLRSPRVVLLVKSPSGCGE